MNSYLIETQYAAEKLFDLIFREEELLASKQIEMEKAEAKHNFYYQDFASSDLQEDFSDMYVINAFSKMAAAGKEVDQGRMEIAGLAADLSTHDFSVRVLCAAVLQIAKQGISSVHGALTNAPAGRGIGGTNLREVVWQGRNQTMHYEEGGYRQPVEDMFGHLETLLGQDYSLGIHGNENLARLAIDALRWSNYTAYVDDMDSLLP